MSFCKVKGCHYSSYHTTSRHKCGICHKLGHGQVECGKILLISELEKDTAPIPFDLQCCASNCKNITNHTIEGHWCNYCNTSGHDESECPSMLWKLKEDRGITFGQSRDSYFKKKEIKLLAKKQLARYEHKVYTKVYAGMGCTWYARRNNTFDKIELFFMHGDNWGQYGAKTDDRPKLDTFIEGYTCID